jgi:hypothetical protein
MAYYLGKDVGVIIHTESDRGIDISAANVMSAADPGAAIPKLDTTVSFDSGAGLISNLTGVDLGIGSTDEDVVFMGANTPLKAEVHKETTLSLTKKKNAPSFDVMFSGDTSKNIARWGTKNAADGTFFDGLEAITQQFGYRLYVQMKGAAEIFVIRNAQMTAHTVTLNADGTQEETIEFTSQVNPLIFAASGATGINTATTTGAL